MKRHFLTIALIFMASLSVQAQKKFSCYAIGFYNLENLFDTCHDVGKNDYEFLPSGSYRWNGMKGLGLGICPARVKKLMISTNIDGQKLAKDYPLSYSLEVAFKDWFKDCGEKELV